MILFALLKKKDMTREVQATKVRIEKLDYKI